MLLNFIEKSFTNTQAGKVMLQVDLEALLNPVDAVLYQLKTHGLCGKGSVFHQFRVCACW